MSVQLPSPGEQVAGPAGVLSQRLYEWMARITRAVNGPFELRSYTVATLPSPTVDGLVAFVSDAGGGAVPVYSRDGTWRRFNDNTEVT
jgi:hypothetical protein